jgi:predicted transport protein
MQVIFNNFPYSDPDKGCKSHIWQNDDKLLTWTILKKYIASKTEMPLEYIRIKNNERAFAPYMNVNNLENITTDIDSYCKNVSPGKGTTYLHEYWFDMRVSMFKK